MQLEIERRTCFLENRDAHSERLKILESRTGRTTRGVNAQSQWRKKTTIGKIREAKEQIEKLKADEQRLERSGDLTKVAEIRYDETGHGEQEVRRAKNLEECQKKGGC